MPHETALLSTVRTAGGTIRKIMEYKKEYGVQLPTALAYPKGEHLAQKVLPFYFFSLFSIYCPCFLSRTGFWETAWSITAVLGSDSVPALQ